MKKVKVFLALFVFVALLTTIGLLTKSDVVKSAYCWDCYGGCKKCVYVGGEWECQPEVERNNFFCFCSGGGQELCNLSYDKVCAQAQ